MSSTYTSNLRLTKQGVGDNDTVWGDILNSGMIELAEDAAHGRTTVSVSSGNVTLTRLTGAADQSRAMHIVVTGTPGAARSLVVPKFQKIYIVKNEADDVVTVKTALGTGVEVAVGDVIAMFVDITLDEVFLLELATGTGVGTITPAERPTGLQTWEWENASPARSIQIRTSVQGNIAKVWLQDSNPGTIFSTQIALVPPVGVFLPNPPSVEMDIPFVMTETAVVHPMFWRVHPAGNRISVVKADGTSWTNGTSHGEFVGVTFPPLLYAIN